MSFKSAQRKLVAAAAPALIRTVQKLVAGQADEKVDAIGARFGRLIYTLDARRRDRTIDNLMLAFPQMGPDEAAETAQRVFENFGRAGADFLAGDLKKLEDVEALTEVEGAHHLTDAIAQGQGVLYLSAHFGNFERCSKWVTLQGIPMTVVARDANQNAVTKMVSDTREAAGAKIAPRGKPTAAVRALKKGEVVGIVCDQNAAGPLMPFFGHGAASALGAGVLQRRTGAIAVPALCAQLPNRRCRLVVDEPLVAGPDEWGEGSGLLHAYHQWLERRIREQPDQWLWMHDRWKAERQAREKR